MAVLDARTIEIINNMTPGADIVGLGDLMEQALSGVLPPGSVTPGEIALADAKIIVGNASAVGAAVTPSGDVSMTNLGAFTVNKINGVALGTTTATSGNILVADGTDWETCTMGGDATIASGGTLTIGAITHDIAITGNFTNTLTTATFADFVSADAGALGPVVRLYQNSASPAGNDVCGRLLFQGEDNASVRVSYAQIDGVITNVATANPEGDLVLYAAFGGVMTEYIRLVGTSDKVKFSRPAYADYSGLAIQALKFHSHLSTAEQGMEFKGDFVNLTGTVDGFASHWSYIPTGGTGTPDAVRAIISNMTLDATGTMTTGWLVGSQSSTIVSGTLNGAAVCEFGALGVLDGAGTRTLVLHSAGVASVLHVAAGDEPVTGELSNFYSSSDYGGTVDNLMYINSHPTTTYFLNMEPAGNTGFVTTGGTDCTASGATDPSFTLKCKMPGGADGFIRVWGAA